MSDHDEERPPIGDMGFDLDGRPLPHGPQAVRKLIMDALNDPSSKLVAVILRKDDSLMLQIMGPPSRETLEDIQQVLKSMIHGYRHILNGH